MRKIHFTFFIAALAAMLMLFSCQPKQEMLLIPIQDAVYNFPAKIFSGASQEELTALKPDGLCVGALNVFLLKKDGKSILFDAGQGGENPGILKGLISLGIDPKDVDAVFITHCHYDHIGGLTSDSKPVFPNAVIYVSEPEYKFWTGIENVSEFNPGFPSMVAAYDGKIKFFEYNVPVFCGITPLDANGHTPGHTIYEIGNTMIFGDLLHAKEYQLKNARICASFDKDTAAAVKNRIYYYDYAARNHKRVAAMHLPDGGIIEDFASVWTPSK